MAGIAAPHPNHRLIPSRFPPIGVFDTVAAAADLPAVLELVGWTNDRLVPERLARLPRSEWVFGRPNVSIVLAAFLHVAPAGMRFNGPELGAWYAAAALKTAIAEVGHHLRREAVARAVPALNRTYRVYRARLDGDFVDIRCDRGADPALYASDSYAASEAFGEGARATGAAGLIYDSVRHAGGINCVAYRPSLILDVVQAEHLEVSVRAADRRIDARLLAAN